MSPTPDHTLTGEVVMGQLIDDIITPLAVGDTRHPKEWTHDAAQETIVVRLLVTIGNRGSLIP